MLEKWALNTIVHQRKRKSGQLLGGWYFSYSWEMCCTYSTLTFNVVGEVTKFHRSKRTIKISINPGQNSVSFLVLSTYQNLFWSYLECDTYTLFSSASLFSNSCLKTKALEGEVRRCGSSLYLAVHCHAVQSLANSFSRCASVSLLAK